MKIYNCKIFYSLHLTFLFGKLFDLPLFRDFILSICLWVSSFISFPEAITAFSYFSENPCSVTCGTSIFKMFDFPEVFRIS